MRAVVAVSVLLALLACEKQLTPTEKAAKDRGECMVIATDQSGFDPITAEEPQRTLSSSHKRGGDLKEGAVDVGKGAVGGAVLGVVGGAIMGDAGRGAGAGAAVGGLIGGAQHYKKRQEVVTTTRPNPAHQEYEAKKSAYKSALEQCLASRAETPQ
ncbi:MAG: hypothetical protein ACREI8_06490 [Myxococcota bacterium]